jgi:chromosome segregation ATPase
MGHIKKLSQIIINVSNVNKTVIQNKLFKTYDEYKKLKNELKDVENQTNLLMRELEDLKSQVQNKRQRLKIYRDDYNKYKAKYNNSNIDLLLEEYSELTQLKTNNMSSDATIEQQIAIVREMLRYKSKNIVLEQLQ